MAQLRVAALMASLLPGLGGCLLYTDDINGAPAVVSIEAPTLEPFRGSPVSISVKASDDQDRADRLEVTWVETEGACPAAENAAPASQDISKTLTADSPYPLTITAFGPVCLFARVTDSMGAAGPWRHKQFTGKNRPPRAAIEVSPAAGTIPLYSHVVLSAARSVDEDGDELEYRWQVTSPMGPVEKVACAAGMPESARCFVPRQEGRYVVQLVVAERLPPGATPAVSPPEVLMLTVDRDRPPCLELTEPAVYQKLVLIPSGTKRTFEVSSVRDDGEPYPGTGEKGQSRFVWFISRSGSGELQRTTHPGPTFDVAESLFGNARPGDQFRVRVEVRDEAWEYALGVGKVDPPCTEDVAVCLDMTRPGAACVRWTTWTVQFHP